MTKLFRMKKSSASGFTLIELLIVIVIIGILAGVLIGVINPTAQQNKARDASVRATINKLALATSGYLSAYGRIPMESEFLLGLSNATDSSGNACRMVNTAACTIAITGNALPSGGTAGCTANGWYGSGANQCYYYYCGGDNGGASTAPTGGCTWTSTESTYKLVAKAWGSGGLFMYRSADSKLYMCLANGTACNAMY